MPIVRSFMCNDCGQYLEVTLTMAQVDDPPPECPTCAGRTQQEFKPVAIGGSARAKAVKIAEDIAANDYKVADMSAGGREGDVAKVRYKDQVPQPPSTWGTTPEVLQGAIAAGRDVRINHGNGLDVLHSTLASGAQPDLIAISKRRAMRVW